MAACGGIWQPVAAEWLPLKKNSAARKEDFRGSAARKEDLRGLGAGYPVITRYCGWIGWEAGRALTRSTLREVGGFFEDGLPPKGAGHSH